MWPFKKIGEINSTTRVVYQNKLTRSDVAIHFSFSFYFERQRPNLHRLTLLNEAKIPPVTKTVNFNSDILTYKLFLKLIFLKLYH